MSADNHGKGKIRPGMVFTIEPMVNAGNPNDTQWPDNWTVVTTDGKRSAQFEHTLLVTEDGMEILTASPKYYDTSKPVMEMLPFDRTMFQRNWVVCYKHGLNHDCEMKWIIISFRMSGTSATPRLMLNWRRTSTSQGIRETTLSVRTEVV